MVPHTWCKILGSKYSVPGTKCLLLCLRLMNDIRVHLASKERTCRSNSIAQESIPSSSPQEGAPQVNRQGNIIPERDLFITFVLILITF